MFDRIPSSAYIAGAIISLLAGIALLYADQPRVAPVLLFGFVLLTILAAIRISTPPIVVATAESPAAARAPDDSAAESPPPAADATDAPDRDDS
jgi:uncharacterized membrane protein YphA (DoxX/SURF4 family)